MEGFSISPLELPLKPGLFVAKPQPFNGNFGIFEDSLPDGYGRYLLHKTLLKEGVDDRNLSALDKLSLVGNGGMGALTYEPHTQVKMEEGRCDFDALQAKALEVLQEQQDTDAGLLLYNSGNSGGCRPKAIFSDDEGHWLVKFRHIYDPKDMGLKNTITMRSPANAVSMFLISNWLVENILLLNVSTSRQVESVFIWLPPEDCYVFPYRILFLIIVICLH